MVVITEKSEVIKQIGTDVVKGSPRVSIITPAYNIAEFICETLDSVAAQRFTDFELILINDGSPDTEDFEKKLTPYRDRIIYLKQTNTGAGAARNVAIQHSRGEYLSFLDGDDIWLPEFLESQIEFLERNNFDLVYADAEIFGDAGFDGKTYMQIAGSEGIADFDSILDLRCNVITSGVLARKSKVVEAGMFEWEKVRAHDFVLWLKMAKNNASIGYQKKVLLKHRIHIKGLSGDSVQRVEREIDVFHRVEKQIELSAGQKQVIRKQLDRLESELKIEQGKAFLLNNEFEKARISFQQANRYQKSSKLKIIIWMVTLAPSLLVKIYRSRRPNEIKFVPNGSDAI